MRRRATSTALAICAASWLGTYASAPTAWAVDLAPGDLVVADFDGRIVRVDPVNGDQELVASGGSLVDPIGIAIAPDGMLWTANFATGQLVRVDPSDGSQTPVFSGSIANPRDLEFTSDGTLWVVGNGLWRVSPGPPVTVMLVEPDIGGITSGRALALVEDSANPGTLGAAVIAVGSDGARAFVPDEPIYDPFPFPSPADASVNGVAFVSGLFPLVTQSRISQFFVCDSLGGVYVGLGMTVTQIAAGSPFRCPRAIATTTSPDFDIGLPTGTFTAYVTDVDASLTSPGPARVIEVVGAADNSSASAETLATGNLLTSPYDIEVVPEPARGGAALIAAATLALLRRRGVRRALRLGSSKPNKSHMLVAVAQASTTIYAFLRHSDPIVRRSTVKW
jgi:hypothetical protein